MPTYVVIEGERFVTGTARIANARKHSTGIAGRRIIKHDPTGERIKLRAFSGSTFYVTGKEVT